MKESEAKKIADEIIDVLIKNNVCRYEGAWILSNLADAVNAYNFPISRENVKYDFSRAGFDESNE
ncbi:hypothetical protein [Selenomonas ruminis]|uniref:Uncharacterized protein n=1 Tax=Selenomonas ruminis TaxID=2593411 RepID=A0A5D6WAX4_9FIRM|nr:hypothetical protein [Selenomonas sp. mPRGC5]TYZ24960.1 hypothetical protein FZ040_02675 [Selenomonas sp. mPRGC5]